MRKAAGEPTIIRVEGVFDAAAAQRLASALDSADADEVRVDLTHVREFHDSGIAMLARALSGRHVALSGLRQHQLRLLRYFGIDAGPADLSKPVELQ